MNQNQEKSDKQKRIDELKQEITILEGSSSKSEADELESKKLKEFQEIGTLFKTRNFFGTYNKIMDAFHIYILKEDHTDIDMVNVERAFVIKEINEELDHARGNARKLKDENEQES